MGLKKVVAGLALLAILLPVVVAAHHSIGAQYDPNKTVTVRGTINRIRWTNPHAWLYVDMKGADGKPVTWQIETAGVAQLVRKWKKEDLPVGAEVIITGYLSRDGSPAIAGTTVQLVASGKSLFLEEPQ